MAELLGKKLRHLRHQYHMTQVELAQKLKGVSQSHIANIEMHVDTASLGLIVRIAKLLHVSTDYLLRDSINIQDLSEVLQLGLADDESTPFAVRLRSLRLQNQMSQRDLARHLGIASRAYISSLESNYGKLPSMDLVVRIADLFGVTTDYLLYNGISIDDSSQQ